MSKRANKVLIVDDVPENLELLGNILNEQGIEISFATNGQEALDIVQYDTPDLILLDIAMPGMDGYEVFEKLKNQGITEEIPVIFLTAKNQIQDVVKGFNIGAVDYVTKPFNATELTARIFTHLELYNSRKIINQQKEELQGLNEVKDKVFSIVTNDLKNPFYNLIGFTELLQKEHRNYEEGKLDKFLNMMHQTAKQGYSLLENVSEWSRLQSNSMKVIKRRVTLKPLIENLLPPLEYQANEKRVTVINNIYDDITINADVQMMKIVIRNLLSNAIKYTPADGTVEINGQEKDSITEIIVSDDGKGIAEEKLNHLLNGQPQPSTPGTSSEKGTGLGLMLCKQITDKHDGKIWIESKPQQGTTVHVTIRSDQSDFFL